MNDVTHLGGGGEGDLPKDVTPYAYLVKRVTQGWSREGSKILKNGWGHLWKAPNSSSRGEARTVLFLDFHSWLNSEKKVHFPFWNFFLKGAPVSEGKISILIFLGS